MVNVRHAVLATLAYHDVFDMPLTPLETWRYLVNPARLENLPSGVGVISLEDVAAELDKLAAIGRIVCRDGFYCLDAARGGTAVLRIAREKIAARKWRAMLRKARWFQAVPYVCGMFASGSLASGAADADSDWDVLTVIRGGRLYTGRAMLSLVASFLGVRRTRHDRTAPDRFCFNHYLTTDGLTIAGESMYNAQAYARLVPVISEGGAWEQFCRANAWINRFVYHADERRDMLRRGIIHSAFLRGVARAGEVVLDSFVGDWVERRLRAYQQARIMTNPATHESGGRTIVTNSQLEFHPRSAEAAIIARYMKNIRDLGIIPYISETDSGLRG